MQLILFFFNSELVTFLNLRVPGTFFVDSSAFFGVDNHVICEWRQFYFLFSDDMLGLAG